jgi:Holliday junction resolvase
MSLGHNRERQVKDWLTERDWVVIRAAGSLGVADLVAGKAGQPTRLVEVKATARGPYAAFPPADRAYLSLRALWAGWEPWLAWWPPHGKLQWIPESAWPAGLRSVA